MISIIRSANPNPYDTPGRSANKTNASRTISNEKIQIKRPQKIRRQKESLRSGRKRVNGRVTRVMKRVKRNVKMNRRRKSVSWRASIGKK